MVKNTSPTAFSRLYDAFIQECKVYNKTEDTLRSYELTRRLITRFDPNIEEIDISKLNRLWLTSYTSHLVDRNLATATVNHYLRDIRVFLYWCMENDYLVRYKVKLVKEREVVKESYSRDELKVLLRKPTADDSFRTWRAWAIINLMLTYGSRASTIVNILQEDLDFKQARVTMRHNKNGKVQAFALTEQFRKAILVYMRYIPNIETEYLFPGRTGDKFSVGGLHQSIAEYNRSRGVDKISVHLFRHTFGKMWAEQGGGVYELQHIFGHSDIRTTQRYINLFSDKEGMPMLTINPLKTLQ